MKYGQYKTIWSVANGGFGNTFLAIKEGDIEKKVYILKTFIDDNNKARNKITLINEINMLEDLKKGEKNPIQFIPYLYDKNNDVNERLYYTIDYFSKGNLLDYIQNSDKFSERHAKILFKKIVEGIKFCHKKNICHLDIKPANIIFDNEFEPIIIDFGLSKKIKDDKNEILQYMGKTGTIQYECPEMWEIGKYTGVEADIFSLGVLLFNLISTKCGFGKATNNDPYYSLIINGNYIQYFDIFKNIINVELSENFKDLYTKLIAYEPKNRPIIEEILAHPWFDEIKNLGKEEEKKEIEVKLKEIYDKIKKFNETIKYEDNIKDYVHRDPDDNNVFPNPELRAKKISNDIINPNRYIIIDGYLDEREFMNNLYYGIYNKRDDLADDLSINASKKALKLEVTFEDEVEEEDENQKKCIIDIELFKYSENRYLLDFLRKSGNLSDYYTNFRKIKDIIQFGEIKNDNKSNKNELSI